MMNNSEYYIQFQQAFAPGSAKLPLVLHHYKTMRCFFDSGEKSWRESGLFTNREISALLATSPDKAKITAEKAERLGMKIITPDNSEYPKRLAQIPNPPAVLYVQGELPSVDNEVFIGIVGTRKATPYGHQAAFRLSMQLARAGAVIVSGGAAGIDSDAHRGAIQANGTTIAVLGCGIDYPYLMSNHDLRQIISRNGALVSEFPPGFSPGKGTFPIRNRIISALSLGVVVIEAGLRSGSLITASHALEQGKDVFAVTGGVMSPAYAGANELLRDGAKPVFSAYDVLCEYNHLYPDKLDLRGSDMPLTELPPDGKQDAPPNPEPQAANIIPTKPAPVPIPDDLSDNAKNLLSVFSGELMNMDDLCRLSKQPPSRVLTYITELELAGLVSAVGGNLFRAINN